MSRLVRTIVAALLVLAAPEGAKASTVCTLVVEAETGRVIVEDGDCEQKRSPASTFKIVISLMGFDAGILISPEAPELPYRAGYVDWRPEWRRPTTPASWMRDSVVWYSQLVTRKLGEARFKSYVDAFAYGNRDVSGDPGRSNGLTNAWLSSSLQISPIEQVKFLRRLVRHKLPASEKAIQNTAAIMDHGVQPSGWHVFGKTGTGLPRGTDGALVRGKPFGWFVGWAKRKGRTVVFARLVQDSERPATPSGSRARDNLLAELFARKGRLN